VTDSGKTDGPRNNDCRGTLLDAIVRSEPRRRTFPCNMEALMGRGILLWLLGVPIPVIILILLLFR
jgi:hypothetical protein